MSSPSPALAVVKKPSDSIIDDIAALQSQLSKGGLYLALDAIRDPGNLGTILRIADWFGVEAVFASKDTVDVFNPKVVQSTMGAIFRVKMHYVDLPVLFEQIRLLEEVLGDDQYGRTILSNSILLRMLVEIVRSFQSGEGEMQEPLKPRSKSVTDIVAYLDSHLLIYLFLP